MSNIIIVNHVPKASELPMDGGKNGCVYVFDFGDAVKIGMTKNIKTRFISLKSSIEGYGKRKLIRLAYTKYHEKYKENEKLLHNLFREKRYDSTEMFAVPFETVCSELENLDMHRIEPHDSNTENEENTNPVKESTNDEALIEKLVFIAEKDPRQLFILDTTMKAMQIKKRSNIPDLDLMIAFANGLSAN